MDLQGVDLRSVLGQDDLGKSDERSSREEEAHREIAVVRWERRNVSVEPGIYE